VTQIQVALKDSSSTTAKCNEIDVMTKESIRLFNDSLSPEAERLGEKEIDATKNEYFRRVNAIAFRAKQQFMEAALAELEGVEESNLRESTHGSSTPPAEVISEGSIQSQQSSQQPGPHHLTEGTGLRK
jgi:hypothetical protein